MQSGRLYNKQNTSVHGTNTSDSSSQSFKHIDIPDIPVATTGNLQYAGEEDSVNVLSGAGGEGDVGTDEVSPHRWGHVTPSGSRIEINDTAGGEVIDIVHRSGSGVAIGTDGSIHIVSKSQRGAGISAPFGDVFISASGDIVIKGGSSLTVQTAGDLNLDVGGTFQTSCTNYNLITKSYSATIDGASTTSITNDSSVVVGGIERKTVAGDAREQVTGKKIIDTGSDFTTRVGGNTTISTEKNQTFTATGESKVTSKGNGVLYSGTNLNITAIGNGSFYSGSTGYITTGGATHISAGGEVKLTGSAVTSNPPINLALWADESNQAGQATILAGVIGSRPVPTSASSADAASQAEVKAAEVMDAKDIVDTLTSARKFPEYPGNGVTESASATGLGLISHDQMSGARGVFNEYSGGNQGNAYPSQSQGSYDFLPEDPVNRDPNISAVETDQQVPAATDLSAKISKYFTIGQLINGTTTKWRPSPDRWERVTRNGILLANNVLDPIKERFPDILVTSWYRTNSGNHITGRAIDIVVESRSMTKHAEIARFARDNLPVDQVFIEKNTSGRTHVHLRVAGAGAKVKPTVITCGDPDCISKVPGINVEWLGRRAV